MIDRPGHVQAARWVVVVGRVTTVLCVLAAIAALLGAALTWSPGRLLVTVAWAAAGAGWNALLSRFEHHGRGAWAVLVTWSALGAAGRLGGWLSGVDVGVLGVLGGLLDAVLLALLLHPDSRDWVARPRVAARRRAGLRQLAGGGRVPHDHRRRHVQASEELP